MVERALRWIRSDIYNRRPKRSRATQKQPIYKLTLRAIISLRRGSHSSFGLFSVLAILMPSPRAAIFAVSSSSVDDMMNDDRYRCCAASISLSFSLSFSLLVLEGCRGGEAFGRSVVRSFGRWTLDDGR